MSNHFHFVLSCNQSVLPEFFTFLKRRLERYLSNKGRRTDLLGFTYKLYPVADYSYIQSVIAYVNRNGYLIDKDVTPFSYEWGANRFFFNSLASENLDETLGNLGIDRKRSLFKSRNFDIPNHFILCKEYVSPHSYCHISLAESFFRNAHHYFTLVSRQVESFMSISTELGDKITYTDEEINKAVIALCKKNYSVKNPFILDKSSKIELAKKLHFDYNASNKQIKRILRLDEHIVNSLFPK